jgi:hypothetical protein
MTRIAKFRTVFQIKDDRLPWLLDVVASCAVNRVVVPCRLYSLLNPVNALP